MIEWYNGLTVWAQVYFWIGVVATLFLVVQIILMCFSSFGDDLDADGDVDADVDPGVSLFTVKGLTAFFVVGGWVGLLTCVLIADSLQWVSIFTSLIAGFAAMAAVALIIRGMLKLQCSGNLDAQKLVGRRATVYVSVPPSRSGRGKITLEAQGRFAEFDAVTDLPDRIPVDAVVEIASAENECMVVRLPVPEPPAPSAEGGNIEE